MWGRRGYVLRKVAQALLTLFSVVVFNFFLFRILPADPVEFLTRGAGAQLNAAEQQELLEPSSASTSPCSPASSSTSWATRSGSTSATRSSVPAGRFRRKSSQASCGRPCSRRGLPRSSRPSSASVLGIYAGWRRGGYVRPRIDGRVARLLLHARVLARHAAADPVLHQRSGGSRRRAESVGSDLTGLATIADVLNHLFLPLLTLTLAYVGEFYLVMRSSLLDVLGEDYIQTARAKGVREKFVLRRHAVRNALLPTITLDRPVVRVRARRRDHGRVGVQLPGPRLAHRSTRSTRRDYPLLQGIFLFASAAVILHQPGRRPGLRLLRPPSAGRPDMHAPPLNPGGDPAHGPTEPLESLARASESPRQIRCARRRLAFGGSGGSTASRRWAWRGSSSWSSSSAVGDLRRLRRQTRASTPP